MPARKGDGLKKESVCVVNQEELGTMGNKYDGLCRAIAGAKRKKKKNIPADTGGWERAQQTG